MITKANGEVNYEAGIENIDVLFTKNVEFIKTGKG